jgi:uncharacterized DUF497 family protein
MLEHCTGFEWDSFNCDKNWNKHQVNQFECEQIFFNLPLLNYCDTKHSVSEIRYFVLGKTDLARKLFLVFTIRENLIRVISARDMSKKERAIYEQAEKSTRF